MEKNGPAETAIRPRNSNPGGVRLAGQCLDLILLTVTFAYVYVHVRA